MSSHYMLCLYTYIHSVKGSMFQRSDSSLMTIRIANRYGITFHNKIDLSNVTCHSIKDCPMYLSSRYYVGSE